MLTRLLAIFTLVSITSSKGFCVYTAGQIKDEHFNILHFSLIPTVDDSEPRFDVMLQKTQAMDIGTNYKCRLNQQTRINEFKDFNEDMENNQNFNFCSVVQFWNQSEKVADKTVYGYTINNINGTVFYQGFCCVEQKNKDAKLKWFAKLTHYDDGHSIFLDYDRRRILI